MEMVSSAPEEDFAAIVTVAVERSRVCVNDARSPAHDIHKTGDKCQMK